MRLRLRRSITSRLTAWIATAATIILLLLGVLIGKALERHFNMQDMSLLSGKLSLVQHLLKDTSKGHADRDIKELLDDALIGHNGLWVKIEGPQGVAYQSEGANFTSELPQPSSPESVELFAFKTAERKIFNAISVSLPRADQASPYIVTIATDTSEHVAFMRAFSVTLWTFVGLAALLTAAAVWVIALREMAPLKSIRAEAERITAKRLDYRLSTDLVPEEMVGLVETLNAMLERLESAFKRLSDFSSDLAHELRTPVTNLLTETQVSLSKARTPERYQEILISNSEELERLARMISDMLYLAKAEHDLIVPHRESIDLRDEVEGLLDFYDALASDRGVKLVGHGMAKVEGDRLMLRRALSNLLSNAVRHTPHGEGVSITLQESDSTVYLTVTNPGEGISNEHLERIFDRFYRVDSARQRLSDGAGLGLAITRSIVQAHGGQIHASSGNGNTTFTIELPQKASTSIDVARPIV